MPVSAPFHSSLMKTASLKLQKFLENVYFFEPKIDLINNVDTLDLKDTNLIKDALVRQMYQPVRWYESVLKISKYPLNSLVEIGPGKVLTNLNKRIISDFGCYSISDQESLDKTL